MPTFKAEITARLVAGDWRYTVSGFRSAAGSDWVMQFEREYVTAESALTAVRVYVELGAL